MAEEQLAKVKVNASVVTLLPPKGANGDRKTPVGSIDVSKDQATQENVIPLSPQWLYAKPSETKSGFSCPSVEGRASNSSHYGSSSDAIQKESWKLDGTQDKKDWRRAPSETEHSRRWREEERETGLPGRRDRRKDDRRADNAHRDGWSDTSGRNSAHETRQDNKWSSSRWGLEEKEKDNRIDRKIETKKEDSTRVGSQQRETESRDKWRPRHRMENHSGESLGNRVTPGSGPEKERLGFAAGRGRSTINGSPSLGRPASTGPIGLAAVTYRYPRGKILDIYRKQKHFPSSDILLNNPDEVVSITQLESIEPVAFVQPDAEEEAALTDMREVKTISSGVMHDSSNDNLSILDENFSVCEQALPDKVNREGSPKNVSNDAFRENGVDFASGYPPEMEMLDGRDAEIKDTGMKFMDANCLSSQNFFEYKASQSNTFGDRIQGSVESSELDLFDRSKLSGKFGSPFDMPSLQDILSSNDQFMKNTEEISLGVPFEDLNFCYMDPQGEIQGPFLGADIMKWLDQEYFGTDLLIRLADAPKETEFKMLKDMLPHLKYKSMSTPAPAADCKVEPVDSITSDPAADYKNTFMINDQQWGMSELEDLSVHHAQSRLSKGEELNESAFSYGNNFRGFAEPDGEEIVLHGRPGSSSSGNSGKSPCDLGETLASLTSYHPLRENKVDETPLPNDSEDRVHPFGLYWSELEADHSKRAQLSNHHHANYNESSFSVLDHHRNGAGFNPSPYQDPMDVYQYSHSEQESGRLQLAERMRQQQLQVEQLQQHNLYVQNRHPHFNGAEHLPTYHQQAVNRPVDLEQLLKFDSQRRRQIHLQQLQRQQQLQQQQLVERQQLQQQQLRHMQLQKQQQTQAQHMALEKLVCQQISDYGLGRTGNEHLQANDVHDRILLRQNLLRELQESSRSHVQQRHCDPTLDRLIQAKFSQGFQRDQNSSFEQLPRSAQQQLFQQQQQQQQLLKRQLSAGARKQSAPLHVQPTRVGSLDSYQQSRPFSYEDQLSYFDQKYRLQPQEREIYEQHSMSSFERSLPLPLDSTDLNLDVANALVRGQAQARAQAQAQVQVQRHLADQMGSLPHHLQGPNQFRSSHMDEVKDRWVENSIDPRYRQMLLENEQMRRESESFDHVLWPRTAGANEEKSNQVLMDLFHQNLGHFPEEVLDDSQSSPMFSESSSARSFSFPKVQQPGVNNIFSEELVGPNSGNSVQDWSVSIGSDGRSSSVESGEGFSRVSLSGNTSGKQLPRGFEVSAQVLFGDSYMSGKQRVDSDVVLNNAFGEDVSTNMVTLSKKPPSLLLRHPSASHFASTQEALSESLYVPLNSHDAGNHHAALNPVPIQIVQNSSTAVSDTSIIDMARSPSRNPVTTEPEAISGSSYDSSEMSQKSKNVKKKVKKGKQMDPALLGFKVTSNRIMMGDIIRLDE